LLPATARGALKQLATENENQRSGNNVVHERRFAFSVQKAREGFGQGRTRLAQSHGTVNLPIFHV